MQDGRVEWDTTARSCPIYLEWDGQLQSKVE